MALWGEIETEAGTPGGGGGVKPPFGVDWHPARQTARRGVKRQMGGTDIVTKAY